ncbi:MAG: ABC transporter permease [Nocardioidaceae bacterium]
MILYIVRRIVAGVLTLLLIAFVTIALFFGVPSDPARLSCGKPCTPDQLQQARTYMQLDHGVVWQYKEFLKGIVAGRTFGSGNLVEECPAPCLGYSFPNHAGAGSIIWQRLPITLSMTVGAAILWLVVGIGLGSLAALRKGRWIDRFSTTFALVGLSVPTFLLGLLTILVAGFWLDMIPVSGYVPLTESPGEWLWHLVGPCAVLSVLFAASYIRITRTQLLEELSADHLVAMRGKGATRGRVSRHALRGVLVPISVMFGLDLAGLLTGAVITEKVFSIQGLGNLLITSVRGNDLGLVVGMTLFAAFAVIMANLIVDLVHPFLDPRVRDA